MTQKQRNLVGGISLLGIAGLICKVIGVLFRIPLAQIIAPSGMGIYQQVFPTYNLLLTISSAGIPVAISRSVSHCLAQNDPRNAKRVFRASLILLTSLGTVVTLVLMLFYNNLASAKGTPEAALGYLYIAPSLLFVCVMSAFRGAMQGRRRMAPTAVSQLIEQVGKVAFALPIASYMTNMGSTPAEGFALGAAGALLGTSIAEAAALLYMAVRHYIGRNELNAVVQDETKAPLSYKYLCLYIFRISIPITIGACIVPLAGEADSFMLVNIMDQYMPSGEALVSYGVYTGLVFPLINVPTALAMAMSANLVPSISAGVAREDKEFIRRESATGLRIAFLIGLPCSIGMSMLSEPILTCLFGRSENYNAAQLALGSELLTFSALTILLFILVQATSGILQGLRKQRIPMYTLFAGVLCKVILNYTLVRDPAINIHGAPFASLLCYAVSMLPNLYFVCKYTGLKLSPLELLVRPGLATAVMAGALALARALIGDRRLNHSFTWLTIIILFAVVVFFIAALLFGAIKKSDLPGRLKKLARS